MKSSYTRSHNGPPVLGIMGNPEKPRFQTVVSAFVSLLRERKIKFLFDAENRAWVDLRTDELVDHDRLAQNADLVLSFGGDGTLLHTATAVAPHAKPILGVNLGPGLGYLTDLTYDKLADKLDDVLTYKFDIEERMMLKAHVDGDSQVFRALNDFVIGQPEVSRTQAFELFIDNLPASTYRADGMIVATPTGSTAYSLSANGPILEPTLHAMIVTPICPHTLTMRPMVISDRRTVTMRALGKAQMTADGEAVYSLDHGQAVHVEKAPITALLVNITGRDFYHVLRDKLDWGAVSGAPVK
ncbi:MAG: NAD(+)/NADH kinase [Calditrichaeota bacterium]|nr:NAD(+)/NADH kinase [Calditrichota bacterium]MCB9391639.1 NAD(+)/NADH kinase [Calditrichota bacterium]